MKPYWFGLCEKWHDGACHLFYKNNFGFLAWSVLFAPLTFLIGLMGWVKNKSQKVFMAWWKFARIYIPIALVLIAISGGGGMFGGFGAGGGYDREGMIWFTSGLFFLITFIMLPLKFRKYREKAE
ncbi:MAG: hypothetical protein H8D63_00245 [Parcubacteria group bacterium]|nr:hypothetical protein [Parcubacteria group bacterium]